MRIYYKIQVAFQIGKVRMMNSSVTTFEMSNPIGKKLISASDIYKDKIKNY